MNQNKEEASEEKQGGANLFRKLVSIGMVGLAAYLGHYAFTQSQQVEVDRLAPVVVAAEDRVDFEPIGYWKPNMMFVNNTRLGEGLPFVIEKDKVHLGGSESELLSIDYKLDLNKGQQVFHLVLEDKEMPFVMLSADKAILQLGKVGISLERSDADTINGMIEAAKDQQNAKEIQKQLTKTHEKPVSESVESLVENSVEQD